MSLCGALLVHGLDSTHNRSQNIGQNRVRVGVCGRGGVGLGTATLRPACLVACSDRETEEGRERGLRDWNRLRF